MLKSAAQVKSESHRPSFFLHTDSVNNLHSLMSSKQAPRGGLTDSFDFSFLSPVASGIPPPAADPESISAPAPVSDLPDASDFSFLSPVASGIPPPAADSESISAPAPVSDLPDASDFSFLSPVASGIPLSPLVISNATTNMTTKAIETPARIQGSGLCLVGVSTR